jgi:hypothetical protein
VFCSFRFLSIQNFAETKKRGYYLDSLGENFLLFCKNKLDYLSQKKEHEFQKFEKSCFLDITWITRSIT